MQLCTGGSSTRLGEPPVLTYDRPFDCVSQPSLTGDDGRTEPSLAGLLGVGARVTALAVEGTDEPFEDDAYFA
ncbi:hypothetical protein [Haloplanus rubicundus]|uniref:hypothetical protein n=1 Tax=Haloplanus rubicundus TaxID=1547898 RepID=UPI00130099D0|nr:hypothetical protein [Haloplanus rubicundus]